jgi:hypothetical protein
VQVQKRFSSCVGFEAQRRAFGRSGVLRLRGVRFILRIAFSSLFDY